MSKVMVCSLSILAAMVVAGCTPSASAPERQLGAPDALLVRDVIPANGTSNVDPTAPIVVVFNHAMMAGMETLVALHEGSVTGPAVSGSAAWSSDRTRLTFTPSSALKSRTVYVLHLSPNLVDARGNTVDFNACANALGGQPIPSGMMGSGTGMMGGSSGMMGPGWQPGPGPWGYGMILSFVTR